MRNSRLLAWAIPWVLAMPGVARAENHSDAELGYSIQLPQGWRAIPIASEEKYIVAKWQSDREYVDKKEGWSHRPELKIILFDPKGKKSAEVSDKGDGTKDITVNNPYRTYKDWVKSDSSGGRYISKEDEVAVNGVPTTWYEVAYEKLTTPRHGLGFVYHAEDIDYCATVEVLEEQWTKLSPSLVQCFKTFKIFPRKGTVKRETTGEGRDVIIDDDLSKLSPADRLKRREQLFERTLKLATDRLTAGWSVKRSKNYVAISHTDDKYTAMVLDQAEGIRAWAEANLSFFGDGYPAPEILRICKDWDEERSFNDISNRSGGWAQQEITLARSDGFFGLGTSGGQVFDRWLREKNPRLSYSLPPWIGNGIRDWIGSAYVKGGKLEFRADVDLVVALRLAAKDGSLISPREMVQMTYDEMSEKDKASDPSGNGPFGGIKGFGMRTSVWQQAAGFVRYLLSGPGKSNAKTKDLLQTYVVDLDGYVKEKDGSPGTSGQAAPKTEEEEDAQLKARESYWKEHDKDLLKGVFEKVFSDWTDADWASVDKSYRAYSK